MAIRKINPTTPGQRGMTVSAFEEITRTTPEKSLTTDMRKRAGRNFSGRITVRHQGGGAKRKYRIRTTCPARSSPSSTTPTAPPTSP